jgi:hypothetical protein
MGLGDITGKNFWHTAQINDSVWGGQKSPPLLMQADEHNKSSESLGKATLLKNVSIAFEADDAHQREKHIRSRE